MTADFLIAAVYAYLSLSRIAISHIKSSTLEIIPLPKNDNLQDIISSLYWFSSFLAFVLYFYRIFLAI